MVTSLPFAPAEVLETIRHAIGKLAARGDKLGHGFDASFNPTFPVSGQPHGWTSTVRFGLNDGPTILMIENHLSGLMWKLFRQCPHLVTGLRRAGFKGGWMDP